jgi:hypothetical protein
MSNISVFSNITENGLIFKIVHQNVTVLYTILSNVSSMWKGYFSSMLHAKMFCNPLGSPLTSNMRVRSLKKKDNCKKRYIYPRNRPWRLIECETSRLSHFLDNRFTDGGDVSLTSRPLLYFQERFLVLISVGGWVDPRAIVRLEGFGKLKNPMTSLRREPATFRLVA